MSPKFTRSSRARQGTSAASAGTTAQPIAATISVIILAVLIVVSISPTLYFERWDFETDDLVPRDLRAPFSITVVDEETRDELREEARASVPHVYVLNVEAATRSLGDLAAVFTEISEVFADDAVIGESDDPTVETAAGLGDLSGRLEHTLGIEISEPTLLTFARHRHSDQLREEIEGAFRYLLLARGVERNDRADTLMALHAEGRVEFEFVGGAAPFDFESDGELDVIDKSDVEDGLNEYLLNHSLLRQRSQREALRELVAALIVADVWRDDEETARREMQTIAAVSEALYTDHYVKGDLIAQANTRLHRHQWLALRAIDGMKPYHLMLNFVGNTAIVLIMLIFLAIHLTRFQTGWIYTTANVNVIGLPLVLMLLLARIAHLVLPGEELAGYLFPAGALGMLGVILAGPRTGLIMLFIGCCLHGLMAQMSFQLTLIGIVGGGAAVVSLLHLRHRRDILRAGFLTGIANAVAILTVRFIDDPALREWDVMGLVGWGIGNGLACSMITLMSLVVFEYLFRVTTDLNLIELTSLKTPLLRELEEKSPGTHQHMLNVSKLAETAAEAIGANYLLVRAGAHYHDIGKTVKPQYFTENQATAEERRLHAKLAPSLSALIIKEHVKRGVELARLHRLPEKVIEFIPQHHGTSLIRFFHGEAKRRFAMGETSDPVREEEFRYPGPKPQTVENAILMLADAVEATATAKITGNTVNPDEVELLVRDAIREKFNDGQLDECDMTLVDLHHIRESLVKSLLARYHQRVDYPAAAASARGG